jgi:hypothetical protein
VVSVAAAVVLSVAVPGVLVPLARTIVWQDSDVSDYRRFPARAVPTRPPVFRFRRAPGADRVPTVTVPVRHGGRVVERDLEGFLRSTGTSAFLAIKGDTLVSGAYFGGYGHDSTVSSFSVASRSSRPRSGSPSPRTTCSP